MPDAAPRWLSALASALHQQALDGLEQAAQIRSQAFEDAEACRFEVDGKPATWLADADSRLGPVCELFMDQEYHWVPFSDIAVLETQAPEDLRDLFWLPCSVQMTALVQCPDALSLSAGSAGRGRCPPAVSQDRLARCGAGHLARVSQKVLVTDSDSSRAGGTTHRQP